MRPFFEILFAAAFAFSALLVFSIFSSQQASCTVQPLFSPGSEPQIIALFSSAQKSISVEIYQFSYTPLSDVLETRAKAGVRVRIILDRTVTTNYAVAKELSANGVLVRFAPTSFERLHAKSAVVDSERILVGSTNWSFHAMFLNREAAVVVSSCPTVFEFERVFESDWSAAEPYIA
ncbi:MAG: phospholipase D-like domain-containing protein [Candidatus Micrarchaeia archaeon]